MPIQLVLGRLVSTHMLLCSSVFSVFFDFFIHALFSSMLVCLYVCKLSRCLILLKLPIVSVLFRLSLIYFFMACFSMVPIGIHG